MTKICVVDDNPLILTVVKRALSTLGYDLFTASDRKEFCSLFEKEDFDLVITDYYLKDSTALEITKDILNRKPATRILIMTGKKIPEETGLSYIKKPFSIKELRNRVIELLSSRNDES